MTRGPKLDRHLIDKLCDHIRIGTYVEIAVAACGVAKKTFYEWIKEGRLAFEKGERGLLLNPRENMLRKFLVSIQQASAESEHRDLQNIDKAAQNPKHWQAAAWKLERRYPKRWGRREEVHVGGGLAHDHQISVQGAIVQVIQHIEGQIPNVVVDDEFIEQSDDSGARLLPEPPRDNTRPS